jgi:hypothetical protein
VSGRLSLDVDARQTRTSWEGELFGSTQRRFVTPTTALSLTVRDLPGGFRVETSVRASYRYADLTPVSPTTSVRVYSLAAVKRFDSFPLEMRLGRFYNPYEAYSAYWDGAMMRLGGRRVGIGGLIGYEPDRANEGLSRDVLKVTGFADLAFRGRAWRYDTDVSFHTLRPSQDSLVERRFAGWSQRITLGRLSLSQRLRLDEDRDAGSWTMSQLRVRGSLRVVGPLRLEAAFNRILPGVTAGLPPGLASEREEIVGGFSAYGSSGSLALDVASTTWTGEGRGLAVSATASRRFGGVLLTAAGRHWSRDDMTTLSAAPGVSFTAGPLDTRLGYQYYRTDGFAQIRTHAADASIGTRIGQDLSITLRAQQQWGSNLRGTALSLRLWRSF